VVLQESLRVKVGKFVFVGLFHRVFVKRGWLEFFLEK